MRFNLSWLTFGLLLSIALSVHADEGMYPMSELARMKLQEKGFKLTAEELFRSDQACLVDGICRVNGCTGSFISTDGLIITNHHCAYEAIQKASNAQRDLLSNGFVSRSREEEIPSPGYTVRITESFKDVSQEVLGSIAPDLPFLDRIKAIEKRRKEIERTAEQENAGMRAEVAEMFIGKTYVLFLYTYLKDVRLVFAPPQSVGNFGGEIDNWEWPRHTADFSFMRAYTAPDGSSAEYSPNNVPYHPKRVVRVNPRGVDEKDLVFLLGYPGRTVRHRTASFLDFESQVRLPLTVESYAWQIQEMEKQGAQNREVAIKHSTRIKSLANVEKRSRGQLLGLSRSNIMSKKQEEEKAIQAFIESDADRRARYGNLLRDLDAVYAEMKRNVPKEHWLREWRTGCRHLYFAFFVYDAAVERQKEDIDREGLYMERNFAQNTKQLLLEVKDLDRASDRILFEGLLARLNKLPEAQGWEPIQPFIASNPESRSNIDRFFEKSRLSDPAYVQACLAKKPQELETLGDPAIDLIVALYPTLVSHREQDKKREGQLNQLYGSWMDVKQSFLAANFVPDANATLRLTYGTVRGYSPRDAIYKSPITTLQGVLEKTTTQEPFDTPAPLLEAAKKKDFAGYVHPRLGQVPVAILYDADTTGGNSGSPVFNARGELIGVNFDRTFEATINDFAWNESYSRSIGVDIRYVLWITGKVYSAEHLIREMSMAE